MINIHVEISASTQLHAHVTLSKSIAAEASSKTGTAGRSIWLNEWWVTTRHIPLRCLTRLVLPADETSLRRLTETELGTF